MEEEAKKIREALESIAFKLGMIVFILSAMLGAVIVK